MSKNKRAGTAWESAVVTFLREHGFPYAERRALRGSKDCGDLSGVPGVMIEAKSAARMELAAWMDEVRVEKLNAGAQVGVCVIKRRGKGTGQSYVVLPLEDFVELIK